MSKILISVFWVIYDLSQLVFFNANFLKFFINNLTYFGQLIRSSDFDSQFCAIINWDILSIFFFYEGAKGCFIKFQRPVLCLTINVLLLHLMSCSSWGKSFSFLIPCHFPNHHFWESTNQRKLWFFEPLSCTLCYHGNQAKLLPW